MESFLQSLHDRAVLARLAAKDKDVGLPSLHQSFHTVGTPTRPARFGRRHGDSVEVQYYMLKLWHVNTNAGHLAI
jgi:hypothetical protein